MLGPSGSFIKQHVLHLLAREKAVLRLISPAPPNCHRRDDNFDTGRSPVRNRSPRTGPDVRDPNCNAFSPKPRFLACPRRGWQSNLLANWPPFSDPRPFFPPLCPSHSVVHTASTTNCRRPRACALPRQGVWWQFFLETQARCHVTHSATASAMRPSAVFLLVCGLLAAAQPKAMATDMRSGSCGAGVFPGRCFHDHAGIMRDLQGV